MLKGQNNIKIWVNKRKYYSFSLDECVKIIKEKGYMVCNIDSTVCLQKPKIGKYIPDMQKTIANCMGVSSEQVSIKATTTEKLGFVGEEKGVSAHAVVLIQKV